MKKVAIPLLNDFELVEMAGPLDILRRAKISVDTISLDNKNTVISSNKVEIVVDKKIEDINLIDYDMILLVGGKGTSNYYNYSNLLEILKNFNDNNKYIASICAGPSVLANLGILKGKEATVFPACNKELLENNIKIKEYGVIKSKNILTATSVNYSIDLGLEIVEVLLGDKKRKDIEKEIVRL